MTFLDFELKDSQHKSALNFYDFEKDKPQFQAISKQKLSIGQKSTFFNEKSWYIIFCQTKVSLLTHGLDLGLNLLIVGQFLEFFKCLFQLEDNQRFISFNMRNRIIFKEFLVFKLWGVCIRISIQTDSQTPRRIANFNRASDILQPTVTLLLCTPYLVV